MKFTIESKAISTCKKYNFSIYNHSLSMVDLDNYILEIIYDDDKLNYLFQPNIAPNAEARKSQLRRFIERDFKNRESEVKDSEIRRRIQNNTNSSYYSFFAEALLARLNIDYVDKHLVSGVVAVGDGLTKIATGADVCMFSEKYLVMGEAKFYANLRAGTKSIIEDSTFVSKINDFIDSIIDSPQEIILKSITGRVNEKTSAEIKKLPFILSGFVLHTKNIKGRYDSSYELVNSVNIANLPTHYKIHLYHLPIESKDELIFKAQRKALDLITAL